MGTQLITFIALVASSLVVTMTSLAPVASTQWQQATPSCIAPPAGLVNWWPGDGNADDIVGSNNGTLVGGATFAAGEVGQAFSFDGVSGAMLAPATGLPTGATSRTVALWTTIMPSAAWTSGYGVTAFGYASEVAGAGYFLMPLATSYSDRLAFSGLGASYDVVAPNDLRDGQWHFIAAAYDGTLVTLYADGLPVASGSMSLNTGTASGVAIGARAPYGTASEQFLKGEVDEVTVWNRSLSASEIQAMFSAGSGGMCKPAGTPTPTPTPTPSPCIAPPAGLVNWWPGDGNADDIIGSNNGTLVGGATFAAGEVGQAFSFDGTSGVVLAPATGLPTGAAPRTVALWTTIMPSAAWTTGYGVAAFGYATEAAGKGFFLIPLHTSYGSKLAFSGLASDYDLAAPTDLRDGLWHFIAVTYDGAVVTIYADGTPVASRSLALDTGTSSGVAIGARSAPGAPLEQFLKGDVDEVTVWNRSLSASEVQAMFNVGSGGMCKPTGTPPNTPAGANVSVQPADTSTGGTPLTLTFSSVTQAGTTRLTTTSSGPAVPAGFSLGNPPTYYDVSTTATYAAPVTVCLSYDPAQYAGPSDLRLLHYENSTWVDITVSDDTMLYVVCGQANSLSPFVVVKAADTVPPVTTASVGPLPNLVGWNNTNVTLTLTAADNPGGSGVKAIHYQVGSGSETTVTGAAATVSLTSEGITGVTYWAVDNAGNVETQKTVTVKIDKTKPTITAAATTAANATGWYNGNVMVHFTCADTGGSGIPLGSCPADQTLSTQGAAVSSTARAVTDAAGNTSLPSNIVTVKIDKTAPTVTYAGHPMTYTVDQTVDIACTATDALSGIASTTCQIIHGPAYAFTLLPSHNPFTASATDKAGNVGSGSTSFDVKVTCGSLGNLTLQFLTDKTLSASLQAKLNAVCAAANPQTKARAVQAYIQFVQSVQRAGKLTADRAAVLIRLVQAL